MREFYDPEEAAKALNEAVEESKQHTFRCVLCRKQTMERCVGFSPGPVSRPFIFAVCEDCQETEGWEMDAAQAVVEKVGEVLGGNNGEESDFGSTEGYDSTDYTDIF